MLDELKEEQIVNKVGGRFKLSTLIQKRLVQLNAGSPARVDHQQAAHDKMSIVLQEILQDKIYLDTNHNVIVTGDISDSTEGPDLSVADE